MNRIERMCYLGYRIQSSQFFAGNVLAMGTIQAMLHVFFCNLIHFWEPTSFGHLLNHAIVSQVTHLVMEHSQKPPTCCLGNVPAFLLLSFDIDTSVQDIVLQHVIVVVIFRLSSLVKISLHVCTHSSRSCSTFNHVLPP